MTRKFGNRTIQFRPHIFNVISELAKVSNLNAVVNDLLEQVISSPEMLEKIEKVLRLEFQFEMHKKEADEINQQFLHSKSQKHILLKSFKSQDFEAVCRLRICIQNLFQLN